MKAQTRNFKDFEVQPLKGVYANAEELGEDMNRFLLESLLQSKYNRIRNKK